MASRRRKKSQSPRPEKQMVNRAERLKVLASPLRMRILECLALDPLNAKTVAKMLEESQTKLYRHLKLLEKHGFVEVAETRLVSGIREKTYRLVKEAVVLDEPFAAEEADEAAGAIGATLGSLFRETLSEIQDGLVTGRIDLTDSDPDGGRLVAFRARTLLTPSQAEEFSKRFQNLAQELDIKPAGKNEKKSPYGLLLAYYASPPHPLEELAKQKTKKKKRKEDK